MKKPLLRELQNLNTKSSKSITKVEFKPLGICCIQRQTMKVAKIRLDHTGLEEALSCNKKHH